jgi:hypothetical protein
MGLIGAFALVRMEYGQQIVVSLSRQLEIEYGKGYSEKNLRRAMQFQQVFPDFEIVASLMRQLSWTHFIALIPISNELSAPSVIPPSIPIHLPAAPGSFFDPAPLP